MITKLHIEGFKSIAKADIDLTPVTVLVGANGAGKSNLIGCFALLRQLLDRKLSLYVQERGTAQAFLHKGFAKTKSISLAIDIQSSDEKHLHRYQLLFGSDSEKFYINLERIKYLTKDGPWVSVISDRSMESGLRDLAEQRKDYNVVNVNNALRTVRDFHFHNTNFDAPMRTPSKEDQNVFLSREGGNIASFLFRMKEDYPIGFQRVERVMRLVYPEFATFVFDPRGGYVQLKWEESTGDFIYSGLNASDGTLRFIALATLLCQDPNNGWSPKTILIDEPELGLHPYAP